MAIIGISDLMKSPLWIAKNVRPAKTSPVFTLVTSKAIRYDPVPERIRKVRLYKSCLAFAPPTSLGAFVGLIFSFVARTLLMLSALISCLAVMEFAKNLLVPAFLAGEAEVVVENFC